MVTCKECFNLIAFEGPLLLIGESWGQCIPLKTSSTDDSFNLILTIVGMQSLIAI